jgi:hypothetical protein
MFKTSLFANGTFYKFYASKNHFGYVTLQAPVFKAMLGIVCKLKKKKAVCIWCGTKPMFEGKLLFMVCKIGLSILVQLVSR